MIYLDLTKSPSNQNVAFDRHKEALRYSAQGGEYLPTAMSLLHQAIRLYDVEGKGSYLQQAVFQRDLGIVNIRQAVSDSSGDTPSHFSNASHHIMRSAVYLNVLRTLQNEEVSSQWHAEKGATHTAFARLATVQYVMLGDTEYNISAREHFGQAREQLATGNNCYYTVNNALLAARHAILNRNIEESEDWVDQAKKTLRENILKRDNPHNIIAAMRTFAARKRSLSSPEAARASITNTKANFYGTVINV